MKTMTAHKRWFYLILVLLTVGFLTVGCFLDDDESDDPVTDTTAPTVISMTPAESTYIGCGGGCQNIEIVFSESMDTASLSVGGELAVNATTKTWSKSTYDNDKLTLSSSAWANGIGGGEWTITIDANDTSGNKVEQISKKYVAD